MCSRLTVPWFALVGDHDAQGDPLAGQFCRHVGAPFGSLICRDDEIRARAWSLAPLLVGEARIDGGAWFVLSISSPGFFSHPLEGAKLIKGEHSLEVRVTDALGKTASQQIEFVADPTGRYTAVPVVHPVVTKTAFC